MIPVSGIGNCTNAGKPAAIEPPGSKALLALSTLFSRTGKLNAYPLSTSGAHEIP